TNGIRLATKHTSEIVISMVSVNQMLRELKLSPAKRTCPGASTMRTPGGGAKFPALGRNSPTG
ncbi:MAG: hypothetical protein RID59_23090, partial [Hoeflea sp.]